MQSVLFERCDAGRKNNRDICKGQEQRPTITNVMAICWFHLLGRSDLRVWSLTRRSCGNLTPSADILSVRVKRRAIHHCGLCTEDVWKATTAVPHSHMTRMVENILLVAEGISVLTSGSSQYSISLRTYHP